MDFINLATAGVNPSCIPPNWISICYPNDEAINPGHDKY